MRVSLLLAASILALAAAGAAQARSDRAPSGIPGGPPAGMPAQSAQGLGTAAGAAAGARGPGQSSTRPSASLPSQGQAGQANRPSEPWGNAAVPLPPLANNPETLDVAGAAFIAEPDAQTIRGYYRRAGLAPTTIALARAPGDLPPGNPPPGIVRNWQVGRPIPDGVVRNFLPAELLDEVAVRPGYMYVIVDGDVLLVEETTGVVADALEGAAPGG